MTKRLEITVSDELWDRLNAARGHEPRASFVKRALESALGQASPGSSPVPVRAPVEKEPPRPNPMPSEPPAGFAVPETIGPVANVLGSPVRKSRKTPSLKDTWGR